MKAPWCKDRTVGIVRIDRSTVEKAKCAIDAHATWQTHKATTTDWLPRGILRIKHSHTPDNTTQISRLLLQRPSLLHQPRHNRFSPPPWRRLRPNRWSLKPCHKRWRPSRCLLKPCHKQ